MQYIFYTLNLSREENETTKPTIVYCADSSDEELTNKSHGETEILDFIFSYFLNFILDSPPSYIEATESPPSYLSSLHK
jgi:hypothetical protein